MCTSSCQKNRFPNSACQGWIAVTTPARSVKPVGWFIQPLTAITIAEPVMPVSATTQPQAMCARCEIRSQPYT